MQALMSMQSGPSASTGSGDLDASSLDPICRRALSNDAIEQVVVGPLEMDQLDIGAPIRVSNW